MITLRTQGGLGNQLFQYAAAYDLACRFGAEIGFDFSWHTTDSNEHVTRSFVLDRFQVEAKEAPLGELTFYPKAGAPLLARALARICRIVSRRRWYVERGPFSAPDVVRELGANVCLEGYFQNCRFLESHESALRKKFQLRDALPLKIELAADSIRREQIVCIQVRRGDYVENPKVAAVHGSLGAGYFSSAWAEMRRLHPGCKGLVFSDDHLWAEENLGGLPDISIAPMEWNGDEYLHKFYLMTQCEHFIISNSTFGWWAAWLRATPGGTVFMPHEWFRGRSTENSGLRVPGWIVWGER